MPIPSFLIEHPKGSRSSIRACIRSAKRRRRSPGRARFDALRFRAVRAKGRHQVAARVGRPRPAAIDLIVNSHLHFDHAGGNELIPNATIVIQKREWHAGQEPELAAQVGFHKVDYDHGHPVKQVEGEHDLFGDGSVVCIPTYGHTPGHQSLKVRTEKGEVVLTGDACYFCQTLRERRLPNRVFDRAQMLASLDKLEALEKGGATLIFGHDAEFWKDVPQAPVPAF